MLYQALTGSVPYPRESDPAKLWAHIKDPPPRARKLRPALSPEMDAVISRAMAKRPEQRYLTAGALGRAALAAAASDAEETAADGTVVAPAAKARRRLLYAGAAAAVLALAAIAGALLLSPSDKPKRVKKPTTTSNAPLPSPASRPSSTSPSRPSPRATWPPTAKASTWSTAAPAGSCSSTARRACRSTRSNSARARSGSPSTPTTTGACGRPIRCAARSPRSTPSAIASSGARHRSPTGRAWVVARTDDVVAAGDQKLGIVLHRIDKTTHQVIGKPFHDPKGIPSDMVADFQVFLLNAQPTEIRGYDDELKQQEPILRLDVPENDSIASGPIAAEMAINVKNVAWVVLNYHDHVYVVRGDLTNNKTIGKMIDLGPGEAYDIALDADTVWVSNIKAGTVTRLDEKTARVIGSPIAVGDLSCPATSRPTTGSSGWRGPTT